VATPEHVAMLSGFNEAKVTVTSLQPNTEYTACLVDMQTVLGGMSFTTLTEVGELSETLGSSSDNPLLPVLPVPAMGSVSKPKVAGKALFAKALRACGRKPKKQRAGCDKRAKKRYAAQK
jgi:hypothetical protein